MPASGEAGGSLGTAKNDWAELRRGGRKVQLIALQEWYMTAQLGAGRPVGGVKGLNKRFGVPPIWARLI